jgi:eukaryotic-like serine/threonine-protein kinase
MAAPSQLVGQKLGHYLILEQIGAGGMGVVYRAHHEQLDRNVALKVLAPGTLVNDAARKRLRKEALALAKLNHPNVETVYDFDTQGEVDFLVMELIPGVTLDDKLQAGPLPETEITRLATQLAEGLAAAHEQGVLHCDLKPSNLRITPEGRLKILDFGIANLLHPQSETADTISLGELRAAGGTLPYMAPEQFMGKRVDARVDIFAVGAVLYEMATGKRAFPQEDRGELTDAILHKDPTPPKRLSPQVGSAMQRLIMKALQKDPNKRYQSAQELLADLALVGETGWVPALRAFANRRTVAVIGVCVLVAALFFSWGRLRRHPPPATEQVLIGDFENRTGEAVFDQTLRELLSTSLEQSDYLRVFPYSQLPDVLQRMNKAPGAKIDEEVGREILQREGLQALLSGSISKLGNSYVLLVKAVSPTAESLASTQKEISDVSQLPSAVDAITKKIRRSLGESAAGVEKNFQPLAKVTSSSLGAIQYFSFGKQRLYAGDPREAAVLFRKAVELDPNFAIAHEYLAIAYEQLGDLFRAGKSYSDASRLVDHVTERERQKILGDFYLFNRDYDEAIQHYQLLAHLQPQDPAVHLNLAESYRGKLQFEAALPEVREAVRLKPDPGPIDNLADVYFLKGDTDQALEVSQQLLQGNPNDGRALEKAATCYLVKGQLKEAKRRYEQLIALGGENESQGRSGLADLALAGGRYHEARSQFQAGIVADEKLGNLYSSAVKQFALAALDSGTTAKKLVATLGRIEEAGSTPDLVLLVGRIYARQHRYADAQKRLHLLEQKVAQNQVPTLQSFVHLLKADLALARGRPKEAVAEAKLAVAYENSTFAAESLAHAYRAARMYSEAAHEFEEVLHRANERRDSYDSPAFYKVVEDHFWLAASYQEMGRNDLARSQLETFLTYWSQADPELDIYRDAKRRLEFLRRSSAGAGTPAPAT